MKNFRLLFTVFTFLFSATTFSQNNDKISKTDTLVCEKYTLQEVSSLGIDAFIKKHKDVSVYAEKLGYMPEIDEYPELMEILKGHIVSVKRRRDIADMKKNNAEKEKYIAESEKEIAENEKYIAIHEENSAIYTTITNKYADSRLERLKIRGACQDNPIFKKTYKYFESKSWTYQKMNILSKTQQKTYFKKAGINIYSNNDLNEAYKAFDKIKNGLKKIEYEIEQLENK